MNGDEKYQDPEGGEGMRHFPEAPETPSNPKPEEDALDRPLTEDEKEVQEDKEDEEE